MSDAATCNLCGEPMPDGEQMFKYHGYSGPCPKPPQKKDVDVGKPKYATQSRYAFLSKADRNDLQYKLDNSNLFHRLYAASLIVDYDASTHDEANSERLLRITCESELWTQEQVKFAERRADQLEGLVGRILRSYGFGQDEIEREIARATLNRAE